MAIPPPLLPSPIHSFLSSTPSSMLSVHNYHHPFAPFPSNHATSTRRHNKSIVERGRSRTVSQVALARKRSEERRKRVALAAQLAQQACLPASRTTPWQPSTSCTPSVHNTTPALLADERPVASSSSSRLPSSPSSPSGNSTENGLDSVVGRSDSQRQHCVIGEPSHPYSVPEAASFFCDDEEPLTSVDNLSLQDQMQQAYAACQTICLPAPGRKHCHCRNMHRARVLYLKTQGIDVTSDDDPRIDQVRDEDFEFVPGGELVLDEESLAAINEERERREKEVQARRRRANDQQRAAGSGGAEMAKLSTRQYEDERNCDPQAPQALEFGSKRGRYSRPTAVGLLQQCDDLKQRLDLFSPKIDVAPTFSSLSQTDMSETKPCQVSLKEVVRSLRGPLFPDYEPQRRRSPSRDRCLSLLLEPFQWGERGTAKRMDETGTVSRGWAYTRFRQITEQGACIACSVSSDSTISRTNSWASAASGITSSTSITSPPSSPKSSSLQLTSLIEDKSLRKQVAHSCRTYRRSRLTSIELYETPLHFEGCKWEQSFVESQSRPRHEHYDENVASLLVTCVRQSVHGLLGFASRMQQSYLRTIQFAATVQPDIPPVPIQNSARARTNRQPPKPFGCRASPDDVQRFSPHPVGEASRELNLPSDLNLPLLPLHPDTDSSVFPRVFAPLAFVPPSPLRPRETPVTPEWRLRPVANPCVLRLKAHARCLSEKGIPWEGRAHTGSLGCGRERLTGVAFEGLGGSRLAFQAK